MDEWFVRDSKICACFNFYTMKLPLPIPKWFNYKPDRASCFKEETVTTSAISWRKENKSDIRIQCKCIVHSQRRRDRWCVEVIYWIFGNKCLDHKWFYCDKGIYCRKFNKFLPRSICLFFLEIRKLCCLGIINFQ